MLTNNYITYSAKIIGEMVSDILMFPWWWYSSGLKNVIEGQIRFLKNKEKTWALLVWIKNIFRPMYAQTDWQGKLISFFMRVFQIIFRSAVLLLWTAFSLAVIVFWLVLPILVIYEIIFQLYAW